jgi:quinol monooxygenase YgiN
MTTKRLFLPIFLAVCFGATMAQPASSRYIRVAELQIDPAQLEAFAAATREVGQASVKLEVGCIALYAIADKDNPVFVRVFEIYLDPAAYQAHLQTPHFKKFRDSTNSMVIARKLIDATPVSLATKPGATP